jgi:hypothetical protein
MPVSDVQDQEEPRRVSWEFAGARGDYPALFHFFGACLNEKWPDFHEDWHDVIPEFITESSTGEVAEVRSDLSALLSAGLTEAEIDDVLMEVGWG